MSAGVRLKEPSIALDATRSARGWLVGPWFDALLVANVAWPLLLLAQLDDGFSGRAGLQFWQVYYVTTPHRWITLLLVFFDRERFQQRKGVFLAVAAGIIVLTAGIRLTTGTLVCLLAVDYVWNAWHFAAQHHGIYRIYERMGNAARVRGLTFDKWAMRLFLLYVILRVAGATSSNAIGESWLAWADWITVGIPLWLLAGDFARTGFTWRSHSVYLVSVSALYLCLLAAVHVHRPALVLSLATASALFHAIEYLALVSWSLHARQLAAGNRMGLLGYFVPRWGLVLGVFMLVLGAAGWLLDQRLMQVWLMINVVVAFLHYAYDGMIWRQHRRVAHARE